MLKKLILIAAATAAFAGCTTMRGNDAAPSPARASIANPVVSVSSRVTMRASGEWVMPCRQGQATRQPRSGSSVRKRSHFHVDPVE